MKSGTHLHTYKPQGLNYYPGESTIMLVKLLVHHNYLLIMGTTAKRSKKSNKTSYLLFEILSIEQRMTVKYVEQSSTVSQSSILALDIF
jgi:hypothetical protein